MGAFPDYGINDRILGINGILCHYPAITCAAARFTTMPILSER
jgi:hypothetical protein